MNKCNGWEKEPHDTTNPLTEIVTDGCEFCTGLMCGDFSEVLFLCPKCLKDYKRERGLKIFNKKLIPISQEQLDDSCFTDTNQET